MNTRNPGILGLAFFLGIICFPQVLHANDLQVSNVQLGPRDTNAKTLTVFFDISWKNSWRNKINHDAAWITVRLMDVNAPSSEKKLCPLSVSGLAPAGTAKGSNSGLEVFVPLDKVGAFIRQASNHPTQDIATTSAMLTVNYDACGFSAATEVSAMVLALEMVYVPKGSFFAGDFAASSAAFRQGSADNDPWVISSESPINVTGIAANGFYYVSAGSPGEVSTGSAFTVPAAFPKGFNGFYMMKYEITEGQWVDFVNSLSVQARVQRDATNASHKNSDAVVTRNTISCSGATLVCLSERPHRAMTFLSWPDMCAFLDWAGLRPMTELEFEKAARGPFVPVSGEYAWGSTLITSAASITGVSEDGQETVATAAANAHFNNVVLTGGDAATGPEYQQGPVRVGIFSTGLSDRVSSGAGNYAATDLSGNVKEWVVSLALAQGLLFTGTQGDGVLTSVSGFEGNANTGTWPGLDADPSRGVVSSSGAGFRGGSWADAAARLRISDRSEVSSSASDAASTYGGRGARSAEDQ